MIEPAQLFLSYALVEPNGFRGLRILGDLDVEVVPERGDIVLEGCVSADDDQCPDNNCCNLLATHGLPLPKTALLARNTRLPSKNAGRRITLGVRLNIMLPYSGAKNLSMNPVSRTRAIRPVRLSPG